MDASLMRSDGRRTDEMRAVKITPGFLTNPAGSCLIEVGNTRVLCSATVEETVPPFLRNSGKGWLSAEYSMLPGSTQQRVNRERQKIGGRTHEIQRLIGRSLRTCLNLSKLGERSILIDCDVLDADGGTRTAAITGGYVALALAVAKLRKQVPSLSSLELTPVAAISVGIVGGTPCLDLHYDDDKAADVDMNIVKTAKGEFVEIQGTAEAAPFQWKAFEQLVRLAESGIQQLLEAQREVLERHA